MVNMELVRGAGSGYKKDMEQLLQSVQPEVRWQCGKLLGGAGDAAAAKVMKTIQTHLDSLENPNAFPGWVNRLTARACIRELTAQEKRVAPAQKGAEEFPEPQKHPGPMMDTMDTARMVEQAVDGLRTELRLCVYLVYYDGLSVRETARLLKTTEAAVCCGLREIRVRVGKIVVEETGEDGPQRFTLSPMPYLQHYLRFCAEAGEPEREAAEEVRICVEEPEPVPPPPPPDPFWDSWAEPQPMELPSQAPKKRKSPVLSAVLFLLLLIAAAGVGVLAASIHSGAVSPEPLNRLMAQLQSFWEAVMQFFGWK